MIEYLEIRSKSTREIIGLIDSAKSVIWHTKYYGVGDFEIYAKASQKHVNLLQEGNYVTRPGEIEVGIIEKIQTESTTANGDMIIASGRFAKSILDRRHIYKLSGKTNTPTILSGNVEVAIRKLVYDNIINCSFDVYRNISFLELGALSGITKRIVDKDGNATQKQVSFDNLYDYSEEVLKEYQLGAIIGIDDETYKLQYRIYEGADRSADNTDGNEPIVFSREYDNLADSKYTLDTTPKKNSALIGGEGEGLDRFYSVINGSERGLERREMWVNASSINKTYKDENDEEQEYTDAEYKAMLDALGKQNIAAATEEQGYDATININGGKWRLNEDYFLGDIVTFQDNALDKYANVRIVELTEVQDENGYAIAPTFEYESIEDSELVLEVLTTENRVTLLTENNRAILTERNLTAPTLLTSNNSNSTEIEGVKISELPESTDLYDGCCLPVVTYGETKKLTYELLKERLNQDLDIDLRSVVDNFEIDENGHLIALIDTDTIITNAEIDDICI